MESYTETQHLVTVWNKSDIAKPSPEGVLPVSAVTGSGFPDLERRIVEIALAGGAPSARQGAVIPKRAIVWPSREGSDAQAGAADSSSRARTTRLLGMTIACSNDGLLGVLKR